jgi:squalene-associated FAD-dependent desaturase
MHTVGVDSGQALLRLPLNLIYPGALELRAPRLPAPWHLLWGLLGARGLSLAEKLAAARFMRSLERRAFGIVPDRPVALLLDQERQPARLRRYLWEPLCVAALNTPVDSASAQVFAAVLRDSLATHAAASDMLLPRIDLTALFPAAARTYVETRSGSVIAANPIRTIRKEAGGFRLGGDPGRHDYSHVILAVAPYHVAALTESLPELEDVRRCIGALAYEPIVTCYLACQAHVRLPAPMLGMSGNYAQWLFDLGSLKGQSGLIAAVISARGRHQDLAREELAQRVHDEVQALFGPLPPPRWSQVSTEKRATFSCAPDLKRPGMSTPAPGLLLCGDYVDSEYPATLESAIRSGVRCALAVAADTAPTPARNG